MTIKPKSEQSPPAPKVLDSLDFEVTDFEQARAALEEPPAGVKALKRDPTEWLKRRRPPEARDRLLTPHTEAWLDRLPTSIRPLELARCYPRIANRLAECWGDADACLDLLNELLVDRRGTRRGFPADVALQIVALRDHRAATERARR